MKNLVILAVLGAAGFFGYRHFQQQDPEVIANPVYAEIRVTMDVGGREIEAAVFGKSVDEADCRKRAARVSDNLKENCKYCISKSIECKADLAPRYAKFFDDAPSTSTYLSVDRAHRGQRDMRLIFWGLTLEEGNAVCDQMIPIFTKIHSGPMKCVRPVSS